jgi:hypothetical protein
VQPKFGFATVAGVRMSSPAGFASMATGHAGAKRVCNRLEPIPSAEP